MTRQISNSYKLGSSVLIGQSYHVTYHRRINAVCVTFPCSRDTASVNALLALLSKNTISPILQTERRISTTESSLASMIHTFHRYNIDLSYIEVIKRTLH